MGACITYSSLNNINFDDESCSGLDSRGQSTAALASLASLFKQKG